MPADPLPHLLLQGTGVSGDLEPGPQPAQSPQEEAQDPRSGEQALPLHRLATLPAEEPGAEPTSDETRAREDRYRHSER